MRLQLPAMIHTRKWFSRYLPVWLCIGAAILYFATLDRGFQPEELRGGDLITHQYAQVQARPSNAPGYPLYTMGGWLWFHGLRTLLKAVGIESPNPIPLLSSYSTLWAIVTVWLLYAILRQITRSQQHLEGDRTLAALLTVFYAVTYFFWYYATTTEQYTSAIAQTLAIVYLYLRWVDKVGNDKGNVASETLTALALLCGLSLAHMLTVAFIVPPLVLVILWRRPILLRRWGVIFACVMAAILPLLSYSYVYLRGSAHPEWWGKGEWQSASQWFWAFLSTSQGREELSWGLESGRAFFGGQFPALMWQELSLPFLLVGVIGISFLKRHLATILYGTLVIYLVFCWMYRFGNWYQVILPAYPLLLLGLVGAVRGVEQRISAPLSTWQRWLLILMLMLSILWRFDASLIPANSRHRLDDTALNRAAILLDQPIPANAALFAAVDDTLALQYLIEIWGIRPDLQIVSSSQAKMAIQAGKPLLSTWEAFATLRNEASTISFHPYGLSPDWVILQNEPSTQPLQIAHRNRQSIKGEAIALEGYDILPAPSGKPVIEAPSALDVTLFWRLDTGQWPAGLSISVRPLQGGNYISTGDGSGSIIQQDASAPMMGLLATESFLTNRVIADPYRLSLSDNSMKYVDNVKLIDQFQVILYRSSSEGFQQVAEILLPSGGSAK